MNKKTAKKIYDHLLKTKQGFCYFNGVIVSMGDCEKILNIDSDERYKKTCEKYQLLGDVRNKLENYLEKKNY